MVDKYTYQLKVEKIQSQVREGDYASAARLADSVDWTQEHNVRLLTAVAEAYEKSGQPERAIDVLLTAYERAPIGKRIMYKLTELAVHAGKIADAETYYRKYLEEAPEENNRYILRYLISEARGEDLERQISILESYKKYEFEEKWACRLAELYQQAGRKEACIALCDEIILWFGVGPYVDRAMELKETYTPLTDAQREHRENREYYQARVRAVANEMAEAMEEKDPQTAPIEEVDASEVPEEDLSGGEDLPVISLSAEVAGASIEETPEVVLTDIPKPAVEKTVPEMIPEEAPEDEPAEEEPPVVEAADSVWQRGDEPVMTVAASLREESEEPEEVPDEDIPGEKIPEQEVSGAEEKEEFAEEEPVEEKMQEEMKTEEQETKESMASTRNLKDILRRTIGMTPVDEPEDLEPTKEFHLPGEYRDEEPVVEKVPAEEDLSGFLEEEPADEAEEEPAAEEPADGLTDEEPAEEPAEEEPVDEEPAEEPEEELDTPFAEEPKKAQDTLSEDSHVLPVLSFEETERAVWEDQTRRRTEASPLESYEMERCIFIAAASAEEGVNKAVEALEQYYDARGQELGQIAKILGEKLNRRGLVKSLVQLENKDLIVDQANGLNDVLIKELLRVIDRLDTEKVFVMLDTQENIEELRQRVRAQLIASADTLTSMREDAENKAQEPEEEEPVRTEEPAPERRPEPEPEAPRQEAPRQEQPRDARPGRKVQHLSFDRLDARQELSERDFIRYADYFAAELECVLDDSGFDALEDEIDAILDEGGRLTAGDAREIIVDAAEHASKPTIKRLFGGKFDKDGNLILRGRDFR